MGLFDGKDTILVIDDSDIIRNSLKNFLSEYDVEVITCSDGLEGIQKAIEHKPRLIFLDIFMPNLDGLKMLKVIKILEDIRSIPVIVISGHTDKANVVDALESGAERVISKPLQKETLIKNLSDVLGPDFLKKSSKLRPVTASETESINKQLKEYFLNSIKFRLKTIKEAIRVKNKELLATVIHELKGSSGMVGYMNVSEICVEIEKELKGLNINWVFIEYKAEGLIKIFNNG